MRIPDTLKFGRDEIERMIPFDLYELVAPTTLIAPRPILQPATPDHGTGDTRLVTQGTGEILDDSVGVGIAGMRSYDEFVVDPLPGERTIV
jgi:hypothetical protein